MTLLIIRHGEAEEQDVFARTGQPDERRPLTDDGRKIMKHVAKALAELIERIDVLASSPLVRAVETAQIVAKQFDDLDVRQIDQLSPGSSSEAVIKWLSEQGTRKTVALVGHEPGLSRLVGFALTGKSASIIKLKKGGACLIEFTEQVTAGKGILQWLMDADQLEMIA